MRLQNPASKQKGLSGPNADIVDQLLTNKKKRSRPISSSLEFQASDRTKITTVKTTSTKNKPRAKNQQQPPPQITATRARGSGGIPKTKLQLQDLEGMAEEEILQALYEDPELAAAAAAAASDSNRSQPKDPPPKTTRRQKLSKYPTRVNEMMDQGVPYKQWIIILLLLGVAAYQIYKAVKPPQTAKKRGGSKGAVIPKKTKQVGDKSKRKKTEAKKPATVEKSIIASEGSAAHQDANIREKVTAAAKKKKSKAAVAKKPAVAKAEKKIQPPESPDSVSTDGSSSTNDVAPVPSKEVKEKKADDEKKASRKSGAAKKNGRTTENVEGWQTVGGQPPAGASTPTNGVANNGDLSESTQSGTLGKGQTALLAEDNAKADKKSIEATKVKDEAPSESPNKSDTAAEKAKRSRKKKAKAATAVSSTTIVTPTTEDDATIALKLQKEEELLAEATDRTESEPEVWQEVATKKRKGTAPMEVAATDPVAVADETI